MKTKLLVLTLIATISMVVCPSVYSDNPPKKDLNDLANTQTVFRPAVENDPVWIPGTYLLFILDDVGQVVDVIICNQDSLNTLPAIPGYSVEIIPFSCFIVEMSPNQ